MTLPIHRWEVSPEEEGWRLDSILARRLPEFSRRERIDLITHGQILVNGRPTVKGASVHAHDIITATCPTALAPNPNLPVSLLHIDPDFVVLHKPDGIPSVALRHFERGSIANFLLSQFPEMVQLHPLEAGLIHRLDTPTSGVMIAARTALAYADLKYQFHRRSVTKQYIALVEGILGQEGVISLPLVATGPQRQAMRMSLKLQGQKAETFYSPLEHFLRHTLVRLTITTGVRHQIRAHLATLGHPITGDSLYGTKSRLVSRLCLHAETLGFRHPRTGNSLQVSSPLPENFATFVKNLREGHW